RSNPVCVAICVDSPSGLLRRPYRPPRNDEETHRSLTTFCLLLTLCSGFRLRPGPSSWRERKSVRKNPNPALLAAASLLLLAGCQTASVDMPNPFKSASTPPAADAAAPETTGSIAGPDGTIATAPNPASANAPVFQSDVMPPKKALLGADQYDDLNNGKRAHAAGNYGLAEQHFPRATEQTNNDAEAWLG